MVIQILKNAACFVFILFVLGVCAASGLRALDAYLLETEPYWETDQ